MGLKDKGMEENCKDITSRLRTIKGHISGIEKMIQENKGCDEILNQIMAIKSSVNKVGLLVMEYEVQHCLRTSESDGKLDSDRIEEILKMLLNYYK